MIADLAVPHQPLRMRIRIKPPRPSVMAPTSKNVPSQRQKLSKTNSKISSMSLSVDVDGPAVSIPLASGRTEERGPYRYRPAFVCYRLRRTGSASNHIGC